MIEHSLSRAAALRFAVRRHSIRLGLTVLAVATACSDSNGPDSRVVASLKIASGDKQTASAGSALALPVVVTAVDDDGRAVSGVVVSFTVAAGNGTVLAERDTSDGSGKVKTEWTVGTAAGQPQLLTASVVGSLNGSTPSVAPLQVNATAIAGSAAAVGVSSASVAGRMGQPLGSIIATVRDRFGNITNTAGARITARLDNAAGTTLGGTLEGTTDANGAAVFTNLSTTGKSGTIALVFESTGLSAGRVNLALAGGLPTHVATVGSASVDAEALLPGPPVSARVLDTWENGVGGVEVTFSIAGSVAGRATSGADGVGTLSTWTVPTIGAYVISATAPSVATSANFTLTSRSVTHKVLTPLETNPPSGFAAHAVTVGVVATDAGGRVVANSPLTWTLGGTDQAITTDGNGVATFSVELPTKAGNNAIVVRASPTVAVTLNVQGLPNAVASVVPEKTSFDAPAGSTVAVAFIAKDGFGNPVPGVSMRSASTLSTAKITPEEAITDADGVGRFSAVLDPFAGPQAFFISNLFAPNPTTVFGTAEKGTVRIKREPACAYSVNTTTLTLVDATVYGPNGRPAASVPVTWNVTAANGFVSNPFFAANPQQSVIVTSTINGSAPVSWYVPQQLGTFTLTGQGAPGYDAPTTVTFSCTVS